MTKIETVNIPKIMKENRERIEAKNIMVKKNKKRFRLTQMAKCFITVLLTALVQLFLINMNGINYLLNIALYILLFVVITKVIFKEDLK